MRSFKSNENIHKKEGGSYYVVSANKSSSVTLQSPGNESQRKHTAILRISNRQSNGSLWKENTAQLTGQNHDQQWQKFISETALNFSMFKRFCYSCISGSNIYITMNGWLLPSMDAKSIHDKNPQNFDTKRIYCNHPKLWTKWFYHRPRALYLSARKID